MIYGGFEFIKMIQKNNKKTCTFLLVLGEGQYIPDGTACPPGNEDNKGGGMISRTACPPGGKINWDSHGDRTVVANAFHSYNACWGSAVAQW